MLAPIAQVVDPDDLVSKSSQQPCRKVAKNSASQVTSVKGLCNVGRAIVDGHNLALADRWSHTVSEAVWESVVVVGLQDLVFGSFGMNNILDGFASVLTLVHTEVEELANRRNGSDNTGGIKLQREDAISVNGVFIVMSKNDPFDVHTSRQTVARKLAFLS